LPVNSSGTRLLDGELNDSAHRNQRYGRLWGDQ
jgi:hypothetical protein